jgi:hypothetical protein
VSLTLPQRLRDTRTRPGKTPQLMAAQPRLAASHAHQLANGSAVAAASCAFGCALLTAYLAISAT